MCFSISRQSCILSRLGYIEYTVGLVLNTWLHFVFFAYIANSMIVHTDAAVCGVLSLVHYCVSID